MPSFVRVIIERTKCEWLRGSLIRKCPVLLAKTEVLFFFPSFDFITILKLIYPFVENVLFYIFLNLMFVCNYYSNKCGCLHDYWLFSSCVCGPGNSTHFLPLIGMFSAFNSQFLSCCFLNYLISPIKKRD